LVIRVTICFPVFILLCSVLLLMRPPPRSPLFPYTTLFRSQKFVESFSSMGASGVSIRYLEPRFIFRNNSSEVEDKTIRKEKKSNQGKIITREQAQQFKQNFDFPAKVSISLFGSSNAVVTYGSKKSNPT